MISRMLGAPLGGTTRAGQEGFDWAALTLISPRNGAGGDGRYRPSMVSVALGEPGTPVICWATAGATASISATKHARIVGKTSCVFIRFSSPLNAWDERQPRPGPPC